MSEGEELPSISVPLPWQASVWQHLHLQMAREELPHALLLHGVAGTGKARLAVVPPDFIPRIK